MFKKLALLTALSLPAFAQAGGIMHDPRGFSFQVPDGFKVNKIGGTQGLRGAVAQATDGAAAMLLMNDTAGRPAGACLEEAIRLAGPHQSTLVSEKVISQQPFVLIREYTFPSKTGTSQLKLLFIDQGPIYRANFVMAPQTVFAQDEKALDGIVNSFQFAAK